MVVLDFRDSDETEPMNQELSRFFASAVLSELSAGDNIVMLDENHAEGLGFTGQILFSRLNFMSPNTKVSLGCAAIAAYLSQGNPGRAVVWAYTFHRMAKELGQASPITMNELTNAFPYGFPTMAAFGRIWDSQKSDVDSGNLLDSKEVWQ